MHHRLVVALATLATTSLGFGPAPLAAQADHGAFVVTLGRDTVAVEQFKRSGNRIEVDRLIRTPSTLLVHYVVTLRSDGSVSRMEMSRRAGDKLDASAASVTVIETGGDTARLSVRTGDSTRSGRVATKGGTAIPMLPYAFALHEQMIRQTLQAKRDSMTFLWVFPRQNPPTPSYVARKGTDSVAIGYFGAPLRARIDQTGRLLGLDAKETTVKVLVARVPDVDIAALARQFAARDAAGQAIGELSPRDTTRGTVGGANLLVDYGRPSKRGRTLFGGIIPWNTVWRTGANAATQFSTDRDITLGDTELKAGKYTLWTVPTPTGATLIVNGQTGQWGTDYDAKRDVAKIPLTVRKLGEPVERFTIAIEPQENAGRLTMRWDTTEWTVAVQPK